MEDQIKDVRFCIRKKFSEDYKEAEVGSFEKIIDTLTKSSFARRDDDLHEELDRKGFYRFVKAGIVVTIDGKDKKLWIKGLKGEIDKCLRSIERMWDNTLGKMYYKIDMPRYKAQEKAKTEIVANYKDPIINWVREKIEEMRSNKLIDDNLIDALEKELSKHIPTPPLKRRNKKA